VFYDDASKSKLDPQFIPYQNEICSKYFESRVIVDLHDQGEMENCEYFGVVSWRIWQKVEKISSIEQFILKDGKSQDFYYANWWWGTSRSVWNQTENWVGTDLTSWSKKLFSELGFNIDLEQLRVLPSFYNYQICRSNLYREYVVNLLKPVIAMMEDLNRQELQAWLYEPVSYSRSPCVTGTRGRMLRGLLSFLPTKERDQILLLLNKFLGRFPITNPNLLTTDKLKSITGRPYYTRHSFVMEALFPTYAAFRGWSGKPFSR